MMSLLIFKIIARRQEDGFTLIELLVVMLITTILAFIALPSTMTTVGKAREAEAKQMLSGIGQAQQAYFFEHATFAEEFDHLDISFSGKYYDFEEPELVNATVVKHGAIGMNAEIANTREYQLGVYYDAGSFNLILCQSFNRNDMAEAPNEVNAPCIQGSKIQ
jgi:type IV pilus assembly protein PilA